MPATITAITNQKGGVGKTTVAAAFFPVCTNGARGS